MDQATVSMSGHSSGKSVELRLSLDDTMISSQSLVRIRPRYRQERSHSYAGGFWATLQEIMIDGDPCNRPAQDFCTSSRIEIMPIASRSLSFCLCFLTLSISLASCRPRRALAPLSSPSRTIEYDTPESNTILKVTLHGPVLSSSLLRDQLRLLAFESGVRITRKGRNYALADDGEDLWSTVRNDRGYSVSLYMETKVDTSLLLTWHDVKETADGLLEVLDEYPKKLPEHVEIGWRSTDQNIDVYFAIMKIQITALRGSSSNQTAIASQSDGMLAPSTS